MLFRKTIASLVTAPITQNVALIRVSGSQTYQIINQIFDHSLPNYPQPKPQLIFGKIINSQKEIIDEVLLLCFYKPASFTGEDVVEISCHGNLFIVNQILQLILENGAELAKEGEFTKQAFFNGKLNLVQASAINDLIRSPSLEGTKLALHNLCSEAQKELDHVEDELLEIIANIKVNIDYPEYDGVEYLTGEMTLQRLKALIKRLQTIKKTSKKMSVYNEGLKIAIVGKPNVGKSTLLNSLIKEEKAIVSPIAGTTRDVIEERFNLRGIPLVLLDTAGIHETQDIVEKFGVERSYRALEQAQIIFFLVDNSTPWSKEDESIYQQLKNKKYLIIINKTDKEKKLQLPDFISQSKVIQISAKKKHLKELESKIDKLFASNLINDLPSYPYLSQSWQQAKLTKILRQLAEVAKELEKENYLDALCGNLEVSYKLVKELSGKEYNDNLLDIIFSKFCLGK